MELLLAVIFDIQSLKSYIMPTGSMAPTMLGYHKRVTCPSCKSTFRVNASRETEAGNGRMSVTSSTCANCWQQVDLRKGQMASQLVGGDRFIALKPLPKSVYGRFDLTVFKYPPAAFGEKQTLLYVGRIFGLPGESVAMHHGDVSRSNSVQFDDSEIPADLRWQQHHMHRDDPRLEKAFDENKFTIIRKPPELMLSLRSLVHDNDFTAKDHPPRWTADEKSHWQKDGGRGFRISAAGDAVDWLRYRHQRPRGDKECKPSLITDFFGYNAYQTAQQDRVLDMTPPENWVSDLMLECDVEIAEAQGELWFELSCGADRFRACLDLVKATCTLVRVGDKSSTDLARKPIAPNLTGKHRLRFANFDRRLTLWIDDSLPFGAGVTYDPPKKMGPTRHDLQPASIGSKGAKAAVQQLQIWRDIYYALTPSQADHGFPDVDWSDPEAWTELANRRRRLLYVQPGHYFMLGDNPMASSDGRDWGVVPAAFLHGRVTVRYFPLDRWGWVR